MTGEINVSNGLRLISMWCNFSIALMAVKGGKSISREGWNGKGLKVFLQTPDDFSKMTLPYLYLEYEIGNPSYPEGCKVPWLASQTDLLAEDWMVWE